MRKEYKELCEDVLDEEKAIEETLERLFNVRSKFDPQKLYERDIGFNGKYPSKSKWMT